MTTRRDITGGIYPKIYQRIPGSDTLYPGIKFCRGPGSRRLDGLNCADKNGLGVARQLYLDIFFLIEDYACEICTLFDLFCVAV